MTRPINDPSIPGAEPTFGDTTVFSDKSQTAISADGDTRAVDFQDISNLLVVQEVSGTSYTFVLTDRAKLTLFSNAGAIAVTIPAEVSVGFAIGTALHLRATGGGTITVTADTGVMLDGVSAGSADSNAGYKAIVLTKINTDSWVIDGAVGAVS